MANWNSLPEGIKTVTGIDTLGEFVLDPFAAARNAVTFNLNGVSHTPAPAQKPTGRSLE